MMLEKIVPCTMVCYLTAAALFVVLLFLIAVYLYSRYTVGICKSKNRMDGKTVLITGCTSGIGKETAKDIAKRGARLIMACRNMEAANKLKDELIKEFGNTNIVARKLDLSSLSSVREFAQQINREENKLDVLIHNAGTGQLFKKLVSVDGLEMTMATNCYGPFLLTHLLIDLLKRSKPSRIVIVSSGLHVLGKLDLNNVNPTTTTPAYLYYVSKYANIVFTVELARRLEGTGVTVNCLHPGYIKTPIWQSIPQPFLGIVNFILDTFFKTPEQGAQTTIHLAVSDEVEGVSGKYFADCREKAVSSSIKDPSMGKKFWELSETLVKLQPTDPKI